MKNFILASLILIVASPSNSQNEIPIYDSFEVIPELDRTKLSSFVVSVPSSFNSSKLDFPAIDLSNKRVTNVRYYYSANTENPTFAQNNLSNERYKNLIAHYPDLKNTSVQWKTYAQTLCAGKPCVNNLFHGFLIEYELINESTIEPIKEEPFQIGTKNLPNQEFSVNMKTEHVITGTKGTRVHIPSYAFQYDDGTKFTGNAVVNLQEAVDLEDIVLGNMETKTASGDMLMSKGMVNVTAQDQQGKNLELRSDKAVTVELTTIYDPAYSHYQGVEREDGSITWTDPQEFEPDEFLGMFPERVNNIISAKGTFRVIKEENGLIDEIHIPIKDKSVEFSRSNYTKKRGREEGLSRRESRVVAKWFDQNFVNIDDMSRRIRVQGAYFLRLSLKANRTENNLESMPINNVFQMKTLGWANIDCLSRFPNAKKMRFEVNNVTKGILGISISLVIPSINSMIKGWKKRNGNYSFTHGEYEMKALYPEGEVAFVVATGQKDGEEYSSIQKVVFGEGEVQDFEFQKRDKDATKRLIKEVFKQRADSL